MDEMLEIIRNVLIIRQKNFDKKGDFDRAIGIKPQHSSNWKAYLESNGTAGSGISQDVLDKITEVTGKTRYELAGRKTEQSGLIPFWDTIAVGGNLILADQSPIDTPNHMINPGTFLSRATGSLRVYGHSMFPKYPAGCIIAYKDADKEVIIWGEDYVIELEDRRIIKRLEKHELKDMVKAVSYNKSEEYVYAPIELPIHKIKRLFMVLGKIEVEASI